MSLVYSTCIEAAKEKKEDGLEEEIQENVNKLQIDGGARTVDEAISLVT